MKSLVFLLLIFVPIAVLAKPSTMEVGQIPSMIRAPPVETDFSFETLVRLIDQKQIKNIETLLPEIPQDVRNRYLAMYRSRSLQEASFEFPRIILFDFDASTIVAFNGHSSQKGFDRLEVIQFRQLTARFEFREIVFDGKNRPQISDANPEKCLKCHQSPTRTDVDPRPNWEPYLTWPGAYGSMDKTMNPPTSSFYKVMLSKVGQNRELIELVSSAVDEAEGYQKFATSKTNHPRYSLLGTFSLKNNSNFTQRAAALNFLRIGRILRSLPYSSFYLDALEARIRCNKNIEGLIPSSLYQAHQRQYQREEPLTYEPAKVTMLSFFYEPLGEDTSDWSMAFNTDGRFAFTNRFGTPGSHHEEFVDQVFGTDIRPSCESLSEKVRSDSSAFVTIPQIDHVRPLLNACAKCHMASTPGVPVIAFNDVQTLRQQLKKTGYPRGNLFEEILYRISEEADPKLRMPEGFHFAPHQNKVLKDFLMELQ